VGESAADVEAVVVAEMDVEEHGFGSIALDGIECARGAAGLCHDHVAAALQELPGRVPEGRTLLRSPALRQIVLRIFSSE